MQQDASSPPADSVPGGGEAEGERRQRAQALLRAERGACESIAEAEAKRLEALSAQGAGEHAANGDSLTVSLARMAHMRALQAVSDVMALIQKMSDTQVRAWHGMECCCVMRWPWHACAGLA